MNKCRQPCPTCPWRKDQHADTIPGFKIELAEDLVRTTETSLSAPVFACHQSRPEQEVICVGWLWRYGWDSISIRLRLGTRRMQREELEVQPGFEKILHKTFEEMMRKLRKDVTKT